MSKYFTLFVFFLIVLLTGCSSQPDKAGVPNDSVLVEPVDVPLEPGVNAEYFLQKAKNTEDLNQSYLYLLQAAQVYIEQGDFSQALFITNQLTRVALPAQLKYLNLKNQAAALFGQGEVELAATTFNKIPTPPTNAKGWLLKAQIADARGLEIEAIISYLNYHQYVPFKDVAEISLLQEKFSHLKPWQLASLRKKQAPNLEGWLAFNQAFNLQYLQRNQLKQQLLIWRTKYPVHPANVLINEFTQKNTAQMRQTMSKISVLLPLSGREAALGKSIQAGILSAYQLNAIGTINFIDTNGIKMPDIIAELTQTRPDFVIGPLLKQHVKSYSDVINGDNASFVNWKTLLLNLPEQSQLPENQFALSMLPEDEATQAAFTLSQRGFKKALILSQDSAIGKRMANAFAAEWLRQTNLEPAIIHYPNGKAMQNAVKEGLNVHLSEERITGIKSRFKDDIQTETRNRQDIDVIYMFATSDQAKLLKPYVDVNISPFAEAIPMFASSRSNSDNQSENTRRDLTGLTFTEIPWLLDGKQVNRALSRQAAELWPSRSAPLERLYAMGIDSLQLIDSIQYMQKFSALKHRGETGIWQMNDKNIISRSFAWGRYHSARVQTIEMD
ncbi:penicillin-binding protein activator [Thalassotalea aquiviva]|uniref:penicillin-binding protein activator n=1 Tax=Thalassotalea aquiviva TaxID=3242415 RepID=UPI00352B58B1